MLCFLSHLDRYKVGFFYSKAVRCCFCEKQKPRRHGESIGVHCINRHLVVNVATSETLIQ